MRSKRWWWAQLKPTVRRLTRIGRKRTVMIAGAMFALGSLVQALAPSTVILVGGG